jgi:hypothetical protein
MMSEYIPTYDFLENGEIVASYEGIKIASGTVFSAVEQTALDYLDSLKNQHQITARETTKKTATHVATPNGLKGEILSRVPNVWGTQVTIRLENGRIAKFETHAGEDDGLQYSNERLAAAQADPVGELRKVLDETYPHDKVSLSDRIAKLDEVMYELGGLVKNASYADGISLDRMYLEAENEQREAKEALSYLVQADYDAFAPPAPFDYGVAHQADMGRGRDNDWLETVTAQMIEESEGQDLDKLLTEEPGLFTSKLETGTLANAGSTREMAYSHITAKTAGYTGEKVDDFRDAFVAQVEVARKAELADRQDSIHKEAVAKEQELTDAPDEALFF